jgi:hypothetical protein
MMSKLNLYPWTEITELVKMRFPDIIENLTVLGENNRVTVYFSSITVCVEAVRKLPIIEQLHDIETAITELEPFEGIMMHKPARSDVMMVSVNRPSATDVLPDLPDLNFLRDKVILSKAPTLRYFGAATSSQNKLTEILSRHGVRLPLCEGAYVACLGEGYGGIRVYSGSFE